MDRLRQDLQKKADPAQPEATKPKPITSDDPTPEDKPPQGSEPTSVTADPSAAPATGEKKKISPWKLVEEHKTARAQLEHELSELKKNLPDPKQIEQTKAEAEAIRKRNSELEEEIRYTNYSKSKEYAEKYQKPYETAWKKAMDELGELTIADGSSGQERPLAPTDMLELVNLPLKEARARAVDMFGDFADDVMAHRKEIRNLFDSQNKALEEARKSGQQRDEQRRKAIQEFQADTKKQIDEIWSKANTEAVSDEKFSKYFKPVDGDEEGNKRLARGYELADKAFSSPDPRDPRLSPQQREEIIRTHTAMRHRAAAFGRTLYQLQQAEAKLAALTEQLNKYRGAEPGKGGGASAPQEHGHSSAHDSVFSSLRKLAH